MTKGAEQPLTSESGFQGLPADHLPTDDLAPILVRAVAGDGAAWRTVVDRYGRRLFAVARSRCRDAEVAEDITQSVFATVAAKLSAGEYTEQGKFESWLFRVAMNRIRDHIRRVRRQPVAANSEIVAEAAEQRAVGDRERPDETSLERLREAVEGLSDSDREVIELRHHGGMSFKKMAEVLNEPMGTLLARHHRALRKLKERLETHEPAELPGKTGGTAKRFVGEGRIK